MGFLTILFLALLLSCIQCEVAECTRITVQLCRVAWPIRSLKTIGPYFKPRCALWNLLLEDVYCTALAVLACKILRLFRTDMWYKNISNTHLFWRFVENADRFYKVPLSFSNIYIMANRLPSVNWMKFILKCNALQRTDLHLLISWELFYPMGSWPTQQRSTRTS